MMRKTPGLPNYFAELKQIGDHLTETHLYQVFTQHIVKGVLGYDSGGYNLTLRTERGVPDLCLRDPSGARWVEAEGKLDDRLIRDAASRARLWEDKQKYITAETVYFVWFAPHTVLVCDVAGTVKCGVYMDRDEALPPAERGILVSRVPTEVEAHLRLISAEAAKEAAYLSDFAAGSLPGGYIRADRDNVERLVRTLEGVVNLLHDFLEKRWRQMRSTYEEYLDEWRRLKERHEFHGDVIPPLEKEVDRIRLRQRYEEQIELFETAVPAFRQEQAYTRPEVARGEDIPDATKSAFVANAAYVILSRLLFVRFAEDTGLIPRKVSNGGLKMWNQLVGHPQELGHMLIEIAFLDTGGLFRRLFERTPFDALLKDEDPDFNDILYRVLYRLNAFDFSRLQQDRDVLGGLYQGLLPPAKRKALGEFYTDPEVVEYILRRVGFLDAIRESRSTRLLDPACGSGAFLVRAAEMIRDVLESRGETAGAALPWIEDDIVGLDINHFAVFIAQLNLLLRLFDAVADLRKETSFKVHQVNSLLRDDARQQNEVEDEEDSKGRAPSPAEAARDDTYDFVVGNPPYVRIQRLPASDREGLEQAYSDLFGRNVDLATFFVGRAMDWMQDGGRLGVIVPRAVADAGYAEPLRRLLTDAARTLIELVPLDWCARELFATDVAPLLIFVENAPRPKGHRVQLVQRLTSKRDLLEAAINPTHNSLHAVQLEWADFEALSRHGWPLEVTPADVSVLRKLQEFPPLSELTDARRGVEVGAEGKAAPAPAPGHVPMLTGSDVSAFGLAPPQRHVDLRHVSNPSLWRGSLAEGAPEKSGTAPRLPPEAVALPEISITLNPAVFDPSVLAAQNTVTLAVPKDGAISAHALCALIASLPTRYYSFLLLRAGVTGGGRRDYTIYPRTVGALPSPRLSGADNERLAALSRRAHELGAEAARDQLLMWKEIVGEVPRKRRLSSWALDASGWPRGARLSQKEFEPALTDDNRLLLTRQIALRGDPLLLEYVALVLETDFPDPDGPGLTKTAMSALPVAAREEALTGMQRYHAALDRQEEAKKEFFEVLAEIDQTVMDLFGLTKEEQATIRRRMNEFPLKDHAANIRVPWERTRRPRLRHFEAGERFHA